MPHSRISTARHKANPETRIVLLYLLFGCTWTVFSNEVVYLISRGPMRTYLSILKGWFFVGVTAAILYYLIKKSRKALVVSEERLNLVMQSVNDGVWDWNLKNNMVFYSQKYFEIVEHRAEDIVSNLEFFMSLVHPDDHENVTNAINEHLSERKPGINVEFRIITGSGALKWIMGRGRLAERDAVGQPLRMVGTITDITGRKQAEAEISSYLAEARDLYNNAPCGYHSLDEDGVYVRINDTELKWLGYERDEIVGRKSFADLIPEEYHEKFRANFAWFKAVGYAEGLEYELMRKDGARISVLLNATIVEDGNGCYLMSRGVLLDISERKKAEESIRLYARRLLELEEEMRKKLAAELHDEIGRDLTALGLTIAMVHDTLPEELRERLYCRLDDARSTLETISRAVRGLMSELRPPVLDDYGLPAALRWHCDLFSKQSGLAVDLSADNNFPRLSTSRELALFRIVQESLTNVSKHADAHTITVMLTSEGARIRLAVGDDGAGFDATRAFHRTESSGWGLTIMRERAEAAGGTFTLVTSPGKGTSIRVELGRDA